MMLIKNAEKAFGALLREYLHLRGSGSSREAELKGQVRGYRDALLLAKLISEKRSEEMFAEAHLEVFGVSRSAGNLTLGVSVTQLNDSDWERFDTPTFVRRGKSSASC